MAKTSSMAARVRQKAKEAEFSGGNDTLRLKDGITFFKPKKGKNELMIVPFPMGPGKNLEDIKEGEMWFRLQILKHFRVGPEDKAVICPRTIGKKCPICEHRAALLSQGKSNDDQEVKDLTPKKRELYYVIDLADEDAKTKLFEYSYHNFGKKLEEEIREADDDSLAVNFADIDDGAVVVVRMGEATMGKNKFLEATRFDFEERNKSERKLVAEAAEEVTPLNELLVIMDYKALRAMFYDLEDDDSQADDDPAPVRRHAAKPADDDEDPPARSSRRRKAAEVEDDDPDPEPEESTSRRGSGSRQRDKEDGGDEDETPQRRAKTKEEDDPEEQPPMRRNNGSRRKDDDSQADDDPAPVRRHAAKPADDDEDPPARSSRRRKAAEVEDDDPDPEPEESTSRRGSGSRQRDKEDGGDEDETPQRRAKTKEEDDPEEQPPMRRNNGSRRKDDDSQADDDPAPVRRHAAKPADDDEDPPARSSRNGKGGKASSKQECPGDGDFGKDCDKLDACEDCAFWADCRDATDEYEAGQRRRK